MNHYQVVNQNQTVKNNKGKGCLIALLVIVITLVLLVVFFIILGTILGKNFSNADVENSEEQIVGEEQIVFDALQYKNENGTGISETKLIEQLGDPETIDNWNYKKAASSSYPMRTLIYGNREYVFYNDSLQRITLYDEFEYNSKKDFLPMFNLKKGSNTKIKDTNFFFRAYNCGINDLWIEYSDGKITLTKISYSNIFGE